MNGSEYWQNLLWRSAFNIFAVTWDWILPRASLKKSLVITQDWISREKKRWKIVWCQLVFEILLDYEHQIIAPVTKYMKIWASPSPHSLLIVLHIKLEVMKKLTYLKRFHIDSGLGLGWRKESYSIYIGEVIKFWQFFFFFVYSNVFQPLYFKSWYTWSYS